MRQRRNRRSRPGAGFTFLWGAFAVAACSAEAIEEDGTGRQAEQTVNVNTASGTAELEPICNGTSGTCDGNGRLGDFFNWTQYQGHLALLDSRSGMTTPPTWLVNHPDFPYDDCLRGDCNSSEFLYAKHVTFSRFLGGYDEEQLDGILDELESSGLCSSSKFHRCRVEVDLCQKDSRGRVFLRQELIDQRLRKYLDAGYAPENLVIKLDNIPWELARDGGHSCNGCSGQIAPQASNAEWGTCLSEFFKGMNSEYGSGTASRFLYTAGTEFDSLESFDGDFDDFTGYLSEVFNKANARIHNPKLANGEFTASAANCGADAVYCLSGPEKNLQSWMSTSGRSFDYWPRSENAFLHAGKSTDQLVKLLPYGQVKSTVDSYQESGIPFDQAAIWQLTLRGQTFAPESDPAQLGSNRGAKQAAWRLQMLMGLKRYMDLQSVTHYGAFTKSHGLEVMDGEGFVLAILNHLKGCQVYELKSTDLDPNNLGRKKAYMFRACGGGVKDHILVSDMSMHEGTALQTFEITIPPKFADVDRFNHWDFLRYNNASNLWSRVKEEIVAVGDLIGRNCLLSYYQTNYYSAVSEGEKMTTPACNDAVRSHFKGTLTQTWFDNLMSEDLRLTPLNTHEWRPYISKNSAANTLTVEIRPNEVQVFRLE